MKYPVSTRISGKVRNLTSFGAFVEIEPGIDGLIHISDMSWTKRVQHPSEVVKKGDEVEVLILNIDPDNKRISLGLKQAQEDPWLKIGEEMPVGTEIEGTVVRFQEGGVVADLGNDLEGFVPRNHLGLPDEPEVEEQVQLGQAVLLTVVEVDPIHHRILLAAQKFLDEIREVKTPVYEDDDAGEGGDASRSGGESAAATEEAAPKAEAPATTDDAPEAPAASADDTAEPAEAEKKEE